MPQQTSGPKPEPFHEVTGPDPRTVEELQHRIRRTREELEQTVAALTEKTQAGARARGRAAEIISQTQRPSLASWIRQEGPVNQVQVHRYPDLLGGKRSFASTQGSWAPGPARWLSEQLRATHWPLLATCTVTLVIVLLRCRRTIQRPRRLTARRANMRTRP